MYKNNSSFRVRFWPLLTRMCEIMNRIFAILFVALCCFGLCIGQTLGCEAFIGYVKSFDGKTASYKKVMAVQNCETAVIDIQGLTSDFTAFPKGKAQTTWFGYIKKYDPTSKEGYRFEKVSAKINRKTLIMEITSLPKDYKITPLVGDSKYPDISIPPAPEKPKPLVRPLVAPFAKSN